MERAMKLRRDGLTMEAIGAKLRVKATAYLAKKIRQEYGPDALARPPKPAAQAAPDPEPAEPGAKASRQAARRSTTPTPTPRPPKPATRRARKPATAKEA
jgi:hypothetical protein